jgi:hypothetical protein
MGALGAFPGAIIYAHRNHLRAGSALDSVLDRSASQTSLYFILAIGTLESCAEAFEIRRNFDVNFQILNRSFLFLFSHHFFQILQMTKTQRLTMRNWVFLLSP